VAVEVRALYWDDQTEAHIAEHGVTPREVNQMVENPHILVRNRKGKRAPMLLIGRTHGGRVLSVPLAKTRDPGVWRPITAFPATEAQTALLDKNS
jgi:uncharacterized DUF497 family protein